MDTHKVIRLFVLVLFCVVLLMYSIALAVLSIHAILYDSSKQRYIIHLIVERGTLIMLVASAVIGSVSVLWFGCGKHWLVISCVSLWIIYLLLAATPFVYIRNGTKTDEEKDEISEFAGRYPVGSGAVSGRTFDGATIWYAERRSFPHEEFWFIAGTSFIPVLLLCSSIAIRHIHPGSDQA